MILHCQSGEGPGTLRVYRSDKNNPFRAATPILSFTGRVALGKLLKLSESLTHHFSCIESPPSRSQTACCLGAGGCCSHLLSSSGSDSPVPQTCKGDLRAGRVPFCRGLTQEDFSRGPCGVFLLSPLHGGSWGKAFLLG